MSNLRMTVEGFSAISIPARYKICTVCQGQGKSSAYLGEFTASEFDDFFDYEEQEAYFNGAFDKACQACNGDGKIMVPSMAELKLENQKRYRRLKKFMKRVNELLREEEAERRYFGYC